MGAKIKHLEFIQGVVDRLASDSFRLKGWSVVLVVALFAVFARGGQIDFAAIALVPVLIFWGLDGYFLAQERLFRALYDHVRSKNEDEVDFSMAVGRFKAGSGKRWFVCAMFSKTLTLFYGALVLAIGIVVVSDRVSTQ